MGSLPPQGAGSSGISVGEINNESITVTDTYTNVLEVNSLDISDSVITLLNDDPTNPLTYKIYASGKNTDTIPADNDDSWINILIDLLVDDTIPANYEHDREKTIPAQLKTYESFSNKWGWVRVQMKTASGTVPAKVWHRGTTT
jgi:hypothetical protein